MAVPFPSVPGNENSGHPDPSPETRFGAERGPAPNRGGRTPSKWLREYLNAAGDGTDGGKARRLAIADHLYEVATSWDVKVKGHGEDAIPVADAKDSIDAAKLLLSYDMGKPTESIEIESPGGTMSPTGQTSEEMIREAERLAKEALEQDGPGTPSGG
jgi:hypothetical protein